MRAMRKKREHERNVIVNSPNRRPYGARLALLLEESTKIRIDGECVLLTAPSYILKLTPNTREPNRLRLPNHQCFNIYAEGFSTAGEAEQAGLKVALAFMWAAVAGQYSARLLYSTPLPCSVYDRTTGSGLSLSGWAHGELLRSLGNVIDPVDQILSSTGAADPKLLIALEVFASARLETTERARFVGMVSSLEPLVEQRAYDDPLISALLSSFQDQLLSSQVSSQVKKLINAKIPSLKIESISGAIRRFVTEILPEDPTAADIIEEAYNLRSRILHDGSTDADLGQKSTEVDDVIRRLLRQIVASKYRSGE